MTEPPMPRDKLALRLKRVAGQIKGCARMIEEDRDCTDILTQMAAARAALSAAAALVLTNYTYVCVEKERQTGESSCNALAKAFSLWAAGASDDIAIPNADDESAVRQRKSKVRKDKPVSEQDEA